MADKAHRLTDEKLEEMEKRLSAIYSRAEKEIQETAEKYFAEFKAKDDEYQKLYKSGKMTKEEYKEWQHWRRSKVTYGKRFTAMKEQCAKQLLNVNQTALAYVNGELPEVYAINYNALAGSVTATQIVAAYEPINQKTDQFEYCVTEFINGILELAGIEDEPTYTRSQMSNQSELLEMVLQCAEYLDDEYVTTKILTLLGDSDKVQEVLKRKDAEAADRYKHMETELEEPKNLNQEEMGVE